MNTTKILMTISLLVITNQAFSQGPPPPPTPSGVPLDGGLITFLLLSILGGAKLLYKK
jgi:hypothetical protein